MPERLASTAYLAPEGYASELARELGDAEVHGRLLLAPGPPRPVAWAQNVWLEPRVSRIESIGDAARQLRAIQRNWALLSVRHHRRAALIRDKLPPVRARRIEPMSPPPAAPLGGFTLLARDRMLYSPRCSSPFPHGEVRFVEDRTGPPNRAYLKLWELFTLLQRWPGPEARCLDLGSAPGGWSWVLARQGARVLSVDKASLAPRVARLAGVEHRRQSAFALEPGEVGPVDWLFADIACYPARLYRLVRRWLDSGLCERFVCTLKFQGETDLETARAFAEIPGSRLVHLFHNRHELTWYRLGEGGSGVAPRHVVSGP